MERPVRYRKTAGLLLLMIFAIYHCGLTLFPHSHTDGSGTVTHSHPYLPGAGHSHSATQLQLISEAASTPFCLTDIAVVRPDSGPVSVIAAPSADNAFAAPAITHFYLRAPPVTD